MKKTLVLFRHGKSAYPEGIADLERPLAPRGIRQARLAGEWINSEVGQFDLVLCSPSLRTRQTLEEAQLKGPTDFVEAVYDESHLDYLSLLRQWGGEAGKLALVGHHPAITKTALLLAGNHESVGVGQIKEKFVTSGVAVLTGKKPWAELKKGSLSLKSYFAPPRR